MISLTRSNAPELFKDLLYNMRVCGKEEKSRNGDVLTLQTPTIFGLFNPFNRVITDPIRDANPFFHVMEFVWMMAGSNDIQWIAQFNKQMLAYSDDGLTQHAAYGHRWRGYWGYDQIAKAIKLLTKNAEDRRVVVQIWDAELDLGWKGKDVPCNTQLMFRVVDGKLNMTVTNRSNDLIWGAMGSNVVHFTMLQELIAQACRIPLGTYYVVSNNLHIYKSVPKFDYYMGGLYVSANLYYGLEELVHIPLLQDDETYKDFVEDCEALVENDWKFTTFWMREVGYPIYQAWFERNDANLDRITAPDWRIACREWVERRRSAAVGNQQRDYYAEYARREQASQGVAGSSGEPRVMAGLDSAEPDVGSTSTQHGPDCDVCS